MMSGLLPGLTRRKTLLIPRPRPKCAQKFLPARPRDVQRPAAVDPLWDRVQRHHPHARVRAAQERRKLSGRGLSKPPLPFPVQEPQKEPGLLLEAKNGQGHAIISVGDGHQIPVPLQHPERLSLPIPYRHPTPLSSRMREARGDRKTRGRAPFHPQGARAQVLRCSRMPPPTFLLALPVAAHPFSPTATQLYVACLQRHTAPRHGR